VVEQQADREDGGRRVGDASVTITSYRPGSVMKNIEAASTCW
jgi:hypothetical protein